MKPLSLIAKVFRTTPLIVASVILGCGTRVGNPKKPEPAQIVKLPTIEVDIPSTGMDGELTESLIVTKQNQDDAAKVESIVPRGRMSVAAFNTLVQKINTNELRLNEVQTIMVEEKMVTALVSIASKAGYHHDAFVCVDNVPFLALSWSEDLSTVDAVRNVDLIPYSDVRALNASQGTSVMQELQWRKHAPAQIALWQTRIPTGIPEPIEKPKRIVDAYKLRIKEGIAEFSGVSAWLYTDDHPADLTADLRITGQIRPDQKHFYLGHIKKANNACPSEFDENDPEWCVGLKRRDLTSPDYAIMSKPEISAAWNLISDLEIAKEDTLKEVSFPQGTQCPR